MSSVIYCWTDARLHEISVEFLWLLIKDVNFIKSNTADWLTELKILSTLAGSLNKKNDVLKEHKTNKL